MLSHSCPFGIYQLSSVAEATIDEPQVQKSVASNIAGKSYPEVKALWLCQWHMHVPFL